MEKIEIRWSRTWRFLNSAIIIGGLIAVVVRLGTEDLVLTIPLVAVMIVVFAWNLTLINATLLTIDDRGISFLDQQVSLKPILFRWHDIEDIVPKSFLGRGVVLELCDPRAFKKQFSVLARFNLAVRYVVTGREFWISLFGLDRPADEAQALILEQFQAHM